MEIQLGGNIRLSGFSELERSDLTVVKKIVGNYAKKISETADSFQELSLTLKKIHNNTYEINGKVIAKGGPYTSSETDNNLFFALDNVLKNIFEQIKQ